jgi:hypothetical protein
VVPDGIPGFAGPLAGILAGLDLAASQRPDCPFIPSLSASPPMRHSCPPIWSRALSKGSPRPVPISPAPSRAVAPTPSSACGRCGCERTSAERWSTRVSARSICGPGVTAWRRSLFPTCQSTPSSTPTGPRTSRPPRHCCGGQKAEPRFERRPADALATNQDLWLARNGADRR